MFKGFKSKLLSIRLSLIDLAVDNLRLIISTPSCDLGSYKAMGSEGHFATQLQHGGHVVPLSVQGGVIIEKTNARPEQAYSGCANLNRNHEHAESLIAARTKEPTGAPNITQNPRGHRTVENPAAPIVLDIWEYPIAHVL